MSNPIRRAILGGVIGFAMLAPGMLAPNPALAADDQATMVVEFAIRDYASWRPVFDAAAGERAQAGVTGSRVFRDADRPDRMLVLFTVASVKQGDAWMASALVREAWRKGGVVGEPTHRFLR